MKNDPSSHPDSDQTALPPVPEHPVGGELAVPLSGTRFWCDHWNPFVNAHPEWWNRHGDHEPVYSLPEPVTEALAKYEPAIRDKKGSRPKKALITGGDADAERAFHQACREYAPDTVGVWMGTPIRYPALAPANIAPELSPEVAVLFSQINDTSPAQIKSTLAAIKSKLEADRHQTLGCVGRLNFDLQYREELDALKQMWTCLSPSPPLPVGSAPLLGPKIPVPMGVEVSRCSLEVTAFYDAYGRFIKKWWLASLVTWDLPLLQGPLPVHAGAVSHLRGSDAPVYCYPSYYDIPSDEDVRKGIRQRQRREGREAGIKMEFPVTDASARGGSPSTLETAFRMWFIEETVCRRYGPVRGIKSRLEDAFSEIFPISRDRIKQIRKKYHNFLTC